jgi:N,N'-diacetyllegionaminate synthase
MKTLIIAEAGVNHNGSIKIAKNLIDVAVEAGADLVKFQLFKAERLATPLANLAEYQKHSESDLASQLQLLKNLQIEPEDYLELKKYAENCGITLFASAFDLESLRFLLDLDEPLIKIPSGEITNFPILRVAGTSGKKILVSTGMSSLAEIRTTLQCLRSHMNNPQKIALLHCTSSYPTLMKDANLRVIATLQKEFEIEVGFSDHTLGIEASIAAVGLGATIIEKHFTLDSNLLGPDHKSSINPMELGLMIRSIRNIEEALGTSHKHVLSCELENQIGARKSLVAAKLIKKGELFSEENITTKRPGIGVSPMAWEILLGTKSPRDYDVDDLI